MIIGSELANGSAHAQVAAPVPTSAAATAAAPTPHVASPYALAILEGLAKLREGDAHAAQIAFQRAIGADRAQAQGHYLLGVAMRRNDSIPAALDAFREALMKAQQASDLAVEGRARFAIAETLTRMGEHHRADAQHAWDELIVFAEAHPSVVSADVPRAYVAARARVAELAVTVEPVRERIRSREHEAHQPAPAHGSHH